MLNITTGYIVGTESPVTYEKSDGSEARLSHGAHALKMKKGNISIKRYRPVFYESL